MQMKLSLWRLYYHRASWDDLKKALWDLVEKIKLVLTNAIESGEQLYVTSLGKMARQVISN